MYKNDIFLSKPLYLKQQLYIGPETLNIKHTIV